MKLATLRSLAMAAVLSTGAAVYAQPAAPAAGAPAAAAAEPQVDPNKVVITAGDVKITASEFDAWIKLLPAETQAVARGEGKRRAAEELVKMRMLAAEARAKGLDKSPTYQQQLQLMADQVLIGMLLQEMEGRLASEDEIKKQYDATKADYDKITARHILIPTRGPTALKDEDAKKKADDIKGRLDKGEDFAAIAKADSADPGSKDQGGNLQAFTKGIMVPEFEDAAFKLKPNEISAPVKSPFGYHIIQLQKREVTPYDEVKDEIANTMRADKFEKLVEELKKKANPQFDESYFGKAPADAPRPAGDPTAPTRPEK